MDKETKALLKIGGCVLGVILFLAALYMTIMPRYKVWESRQAGIAELARATYSRQIAVREAEAKLEAAGRLADAEVARAKGVARANKIIGDSLHGNEDYLRYLWIQGMENRQGDVVYVPTEAGIPILEAGRVASRRK